MAVREHVLLSVCCGIRAWIRTVSPVPRTITSYSSSMLDQRLSRRSLLAKERKVCCRGSLSEAPRNKRRGVVRLFLLIRLGWGEILFDNRRHLMSNGRGAPLSQPKTTKDGPASAALQNNDAARHKLVRPPASH